MFETGKVEKDSIMQWAILESGYLHIKKYQLAN